MRFRQINLRKLWLSLLLLVGATAIAVPGIQEVMDGNVAKIGSNEYGTLQEAVNAAQQAGGSQTISLIGDVSSETVTINEVANFKLTIDGKKDESSNYTVDARIVVDGLRGNGGSNANGASVTIQNIAFVNNSSADGIQPKHYPHHLTIQDCTYTGSSSSSNKWFINVSDAPLYNATIKNVTVENSRLIQASLGLDVVFENIIATNNCTAGFNIKTEGTVLIKNCQITTAKYAFRDMVDEYVGTITLENNTFISTSTGSDEGAIVNRGGAVGTAHINVESGTYTGPIKVMNNKEGVLAISGGYFSEEFPQEYIAADLVAQGKVCATATDKPGFYTVGEPHYVAQIGETGYVTLQAAIDAAHSMTGDVTIELIDNISGYSIVHQKAGLNLTIDGKDKSLAGQIIIDGDGSLNGTDAITIQNIKFEMPSELCTGTDAFVVVPSTKTTGTPYYDTSHNNHAHNITISDCTFTGNYPTSNIVGFKSHSGIDGMKNLVMENVTATNLHSLARLTATKGATFDNCTATQTGSFIGANGGDGTYTVSNCTFESHPDKADGYAYREKSSSTAVATLTNNNFKAHDAIILGSAGTINVESGTYVGEISKTAGTIALSGGQFSAPIGDAEYAGYFAEGLCGVNGLYEGDAPNGVGTAVASITTDETTIKFATFEAAVDAATSGETIELLANITDAYTMSEGQTLKVKKNGKSITVKAPEKYVLNSTTTDGVTTYTIAEADYMFTQESNGKVTYYQISKLSAFTTAGTFKLLKDATRTTRTAASALAGNANVILDLNGHTLTYTSEDVTFILSGIYGSESAPKTIKIVDNSETGGGKLVMNKDIQITGRYFDVTIGEGVTVEGGSVLIDSKYYNKLTVEGTINGGDEFAVVTNGNAENANITIKNGAVLTSNSVAMYLPGTGTTTIEEGAKVTGTTGIYVKSATLNIEGGEITGNGPAAEYAYNNNGCNSTGQALVVDNCNYPGGAPTVNITGGKFTTANNESAIGSYAHGDGAEPLGEFVHGGYFSTELPREICEAGKRTVPSTTVEGYYELGEVVFVAQIGDVKYETLADAVAAVPAGTETTITMIDNETIVGNAGVTIPVGKNIVLDLNGKTVTLSVTESKGSQLITNRGTLTITDGSEGQAGKLTNVADESLAVGSWPTNNYVTNIITNSGTLNIEAGNIISTANGSICYAVDNNSTSYDAILNIKGGYLTSVGTVVRQFCNSTTKQNVINMTGGVVTTNGSAAIWTQLPGSNASSKKLATLNISGGEITASSYAWYDYSYGDSFEAVEYNISGGKFTGRIFSYALRDGIISGFISGGLFSPAPSSSYIKPAGYMFGPSEEVEGYYTLVPAEVDYSWTENGKEYHNYLPFNTPFKNNYLMDGETITLMQNITLTENLTWAVETETATSTLTFGEYKITKGDYSVALNPGETIKTDKRTDIFTSANSDYELVETAVSGGYTYSLLKNAIEPVAPEKPAVNPDFSVKIPTGTYQIKNNATGNYVNIVSKYYAKAEGTESTDYTKIGVGVGYKVADGYRVFSLTGKNPADNSEIEAYNYVAKAYTMAVKLVQEKITGRFSDNFSATTIDELNAFADSVCAIYIDDYAYLTLVPVSTDGTNYQVRAMATVPAIPNTVWTLGNSMIRGHVIDGHTCTDTWDWAKWQVYHYINTHSQMDATLQSMVKANLESIVPGTTYFLTAEEDGTLGYATTMTDATLWTMEPVETVEDGLTPDEYHIQNVGTEKFVNVTDTYYAKVDITEDDLIMEEIPATLINVDFGRSSKDNPNLYRITELSNGDKDVVAYVKKAVNKVKSLAANMTLNGTPLYEAMANKINELLGVQIAPADIKEDVELALDLCGEHYAYLNLVDNGDGTVSVYGDMPKVPALLDHAIKKLNLADDFLTWAKAQIDDYFATSGSNATLISLWNGNKGKIVPGQR